MEDKRACLAMAVSTVLSALHLALVRWHPHPASPKLTPFAKASHSSPTRGEEGSDYFARTTACFFLPKDSFTTPSESRSAVVILRFSSSITASLRRAPPPLIRRRASPLLAARPVRRSSS